MRATPITTFSLSLLAVGVLIVGSIALSPYGNAATTTATSSTSTSPNATTSPETEGGTTTRDGDEVATTTNENNVEEQAPEQLVVPVEDLNIIAFGDSLVAGVGTSDEGFVSDLRKWTDLPITNRGTIGDTTEEGLERLDNDVIEHNPHVVLLLIGGNDILQRIDREETLDNLEEIITRIQDETKARVVFLGAHGELFRFDRESDYQNLADETDAFYVPRVMRGILGNPTRLSDPVHPNDAGYELIAERTLPILQDAIADIPTEGISGICEPDPTRAQIDQQVTWSAYAVGGNEGRPAYSWDGDGGLSGPGNTQEIRYETQGAKESSVEVTAGEESRTLQCSPSVRVIPPPLTGSCRVAMNANSKKLAWEAQAAGGIGPIEYEWEGSDGLNSTERMVTHEYFNDGIKNGTVTISSENQSITLPCQAEIMQNPPAELQNVRASCDVESPPYVVDEEITWDADIFGINSSDVTFAWDGNGDLDQRRTNPSQAIGTYGSAGVKRTQIEMRTPHRELDFQCAIAVAKEEPHRRGGEGCFIATAAYGTELAPQLVHLRAFRDETLQTNPLGNALVSLYYTVSPPIADIISEHDWMRTATQYTLKPVIALVK